ncbi:hypothetical protein LCGC14_2603110 [marine sediment metagenome]|uniref:Uncharacterized protein n=1 Tax=marine sediment metagenome TaxID=412755 RepID=A0A0F9A8H0_9ZZZZ
MFRFGIKGPRGDAGAAGADGAQGEQGIQGDQGIQGIQGDAGAAGSNLIYTPRDDASAYDFTAGSFTQDGAWRALDLSGIIPAAARVIHYRVGYGATATGKAFRIKPFTGSTVYGSTVMQTIVANIPHNYAGVCGCLSQEVYYNADSATWSWIDFLILGWWATS